MTPRLTLALARAALRHASSILPAERRDWGAAMQAELQAIDPPGAALAFAAGCLWTAISERNAAMSSVQKSIHAAAILALVGLALVTAFSTNDLLGVHGPTAAVFAFLCLIYLGTGLLTFVRGSGALVRTASVMLGISAFAFLALPFFESRFLNAELYQALSAESMAIWVVLLGLGVAMGRMATGDRNLTPHP